MIRVVEHDGAGVFLRRAGEWLHRREDHHNLIVGFAQALAGVREADPEILAATVEVDGDLEGCVLRAPPHQALLTSMPREGAVEVGRLLARRIRGLSGVVGPREAALAAAEGWAEAGGGAWREGMHQGLYRLERVTPPAPVAGGMRAAGPGDAAEVVRWGRAFVDETGIEFHVTDEVVARWIHAGALWCWEVDGAVVTMAVAQGRTARGIRIGFVYTPPAARRKGYASALVGALSQAMLDSGCRFCVLYTDLANPTSNAIYQRLGYERIGDVLDVHLVEGGGA